MNRQPLLRCLPDGLSEVTRAWEGETVALLGGGPSLTQEQVDSVRAAGARAIAINDAYLLAPWADVSYFCDSEWHGWHSKGIDKPALGLTAEQVRERFEAFAGERCTMEITGAHVHDPAVHKLRKAGTEGLSLDPRAIFTGRNSGFQALNIAILSGASTILLLGYDAREPHGGATHWHGGHPRREPEEVYRQHRRSFTAAENEIKATGVTVLNCSPGSMITSFPRVPLDLALQPMVAYG